MCGSRKNCQRGSDSDNVFFDEGRENLKTLKAGHLQPASEMPLIGVWLASPWGPSLNASLEALCLFRGSVPVLLRNPIFL